MKVISLNMHGYQEIDTLDNIKRLAKYIKNSKIEVILLQEVAEKLNKNETNTASILHSLLKGYDIYYEIFKSPDKLHGEGLAIISKYKLENKKSKLISSTNDFNSWQKRKVLYATIKVKEEDILVCTTHLGWTTRSESFKDQALKLHNIVAKFNYDKVIVGGDFNCPKFFYNYRYLKNMQLENIFENHNKPTYIGNEGIPLTKKTRMIDHVFTRGFEIKRKGRRFVKHPISDHVLLYSEVV